MGAPRPHCEPSGARRANTMPDFESKFEFAHKQSTQWSLSFVQRTTSLWLADGMFYTYFLKSISNRKTYVGKTGKQPTVRLEEHNNGANVWTKTNGPFKLIYYETFCCKEDASNREKFYKSGIGKKIKKAIILVMDD